MYVKEVSILEGTGERQAGSRGPMVGAWSEVHSPRSHSTRCHSSLGVA